MSTVPVETGGVTNQPKRAYKIARRAKQEVSDRDGTLQFEHSTLAGIGSLIGCSEYVLDMHDLAFPSPLYTEQPFGTLLKAGVRWIEGRGIKKARQVITVSGQMADLATEEWSVPRDRFDVLPNGYFRETVEAVTPRQTDGTRVAFLGTLHPKLDVESFVAVARLDGVDELAVIGDGAKREALEDAAHDSQSLRVYGQVPGTEAYDIIAGSSLAINPQRPSPLQRASSPVKLYYYAALGVPMVVSEGPDIAAQLADAGAVELVSPDERFHERVRGLISDQERLDRMSEMALTAASDWSWQERARELARIYETMTNTYTDTDERVIEQ
jgi:glycosyltransferase involved in cell wall biosynthesis